MCVCVCLCHGVHRQTNRHSKDISEIVPAHTRAHTHAEITRTPLSCDGDEYLTAGCLTLIRSRSSYNHAYKHEYLCVCVCIYLFFFLFVFLSIPYSWLPNSLFLLDIGILICPTTSCRPCHRTFLPGFHRFCEYACFSWLSTEMLCLSASVDFLSFLDMYLPAILVLRVCVCVFSVACVCVFVSRCAPADEQTQ